MSDDGTCNVLFLVLPVTVFVCVQNISGTAEQICAKFTGKTRLVPPSDEFECQRSRSPGNKKTAFFNPFGDLHAVYVWLVAWLEFNVSFQHKSGYIRDKFMFCKTSLVSSLMFFSGIFSGCPQ